MGICATILVSLLLVFNAAVAQNVHKEYDQWHFGTIGLYPAGGSSQSGCLAALEGCAVYRTPLLNTADSTYWTIITDGVTVVDQYCRIAFNGSGLMGHPSSSQSALIVPHPGDSAVYFIFTAGAGPYVTDDNNGIRFSKVFPYSSLFLQVTERNTVLLDTATEKLVAVGHCNDRDYWVLAHGWGDNNFYAWLVSDTGVSRQPIVSSVGAVHSRLTAEYTIGYMKASPNGKRLALACNSMQTVQLFDFDNSTGIVSNPISLPSVGSNYSGEYGVSFSPDNTRLYISGIDSTLQSTLYQYTVTGTPAEIVASRQLIFSAPVVGNPSNQIAALQLYRDGTILCARAESVFLGRVRYPNAAGVLCGYEHNGVRLAAGGSSFGLPNNIDKQYNTGASCYRPNAYFSQNTKNICVGQCINFLDSSRHRPTSWKWLFPGGEPAVSTEQNPPNICYHQPGTYSATLIVSNDRGRDTLVFPGAVVVWSYPQADAGSDITICAGSEVSLHGSGGGAYRWSPDYKLSNKNIAAPIARPLKTTEYVLQVSNGPCLDYDTVVVTVLEPRRILPALYNICAGDSIRHFYPASGTYHWEPATGLSDPNSNEPWISVQQTTQYTVTLIDENGCSSSAVVEVRVHPVPVVNAGKDIAICPGEAVRLTANSGEAGGQYLWKPAAGLDDPDKHNPIATPLHTTTYIVTFTAPTGCKAVDSVTVVVFPTPIIDAGLDTMICFGSEIELRAAGPPGKYSWTPVAGIEDPHQQVAKAQPATTTMYRVELADNNGCTTVDSVLVTVRKPIARAGTDVAVCKGESVRIRATGSEGTYAWTPEEGLDNPMSKSPLASPLQTTVYAVTITDKFGCTAVDSVVVSVATTGTVDAGEDRTVCVGDAVQLNASGITGVYSWTPVEGLSDPTSDNPLASPQQTTVYTVFVRSPGGCEATDSVVITVLPRPQIDAGQDISICRNSSAQLRATGDPGRYYWQPDTGLDNPASASPMASPSETTMYYVTLIGENGCTQTDSMVVFVADTLMVQAGADRSMCKGDTVRLVLASAGGTVLWTPAEGLDDPSSISPLFFPAATTTYRVTVTDAGGCSGSDEVTITVFPQPVVDAGANQAFCRGGRVRLALTGSEGDVLWAPGQGLDDPTSRTPFASPGSTTLYRVTLTSQGGCTATDSVLVAVDEPPVLLAEGDTTVCADQPVVLTARAGSGVYRWEPSEDIESPDSATTLARPAMSTVYTVRYSDGSGCTAVDSVAVVVNDNAVVTLVVPDTVAAVGDRRFRLPVVLRATSAVAGPVSLAFTLRYQEKVMKFTGISRGAVSEHYQGEDGLLSVRIDNVSVVPGETVIAELAAVPLLSSIERTELAIALDTLLPIPCVTLLHVDGSLTVDGICVDSDIRFFARTRIALGPNPASETLLVQILSPGGETSEKPEIEIQTLWGTSIHVPFSEESSGTDGRKLLCDVSSLASGTYSLVVRFAGQQYAHPLCIIK